MGRYKKQKRKIEQARKEFERMKQKGEDVDDSFLAQLQKHEAFVEDLNKMGLLNLRNSDRLPMCEPIGVFAKKVWVNLENPDEPPKIIYDHSKKLEKGEELKVPESQSQEKVIELLE